MLSFVIGLVIGMFGGFVTGAIIAKGSEEENND